MVADLSDLLGRLTTDAARVTELRSQQDALEALEAHCANGPAGGVQACQALQHLAGLLAARCSEGAALPETLEYSAYFTALLKAMAALLSEAKAGHTLDVPPFVGHLKLFWTYGLLPPGTDPISPEPFGGRRLGQTTPRVGDKHGKEVAPGRSAAYLPPHQRRRPNGKSGSQAEAAVSGSDSEASDCEGTSADRLKASKARHAALTCLQLVAKWDPKSLHQLWLTLLPQQSLAPTISRRGNLSLLDVLVNDPSSKVRLAAGAALACMLEGGPQKAFLGIAERSDADKRPARGFITLSASLGLMALALHEGLLEALVRESSSAVLAQDLKALAALVAGTPYHRLPSGLLTRTLQGLRQCLTACTSGAATARANTRMVRLAALYSLAALFGTRERHAEVAAWLGQPASEAAEGRGLLLDLLHTSQAGDPVVCMEALLVLTRVAGNYPAALLPYTSWLLKIAHSFATQSPGQPSGEATDLCAMQAIRLAGVLLSSDQQPSASDIPGCSQERHSKDQAHAAESQRATDGQNLQPWIELAEKGLNHSSAAVRSATYSLVSAAGNIVDGAAVAQQHLDWAVSQLGAGGKDPVPAVRAAAAKAASSLASNQLLYESAGLRNLTLLVCQLLEDQSVSVRVQSAAALAAVADGLAESSKVDPNVVHDLSAMMVAGALKSRSDNERVALQCIRALGRLLPLQGPNAEQHGSLSMTLQAILDSLQTGSYKAQWNACYALSSLLSHQAVGHHMKHCSQTPLILDQLAHIVTTAPNFKSRMHAAASLAKVASVEQCCGRYDTICAALDTAVNESGVPSSTLGGGGSAYAAAQIDPSPSTSGAGEGLQGSLDFKSLPGMLAQLQASLEHYRGLQ